MLGLNSKPDLDPANAKVMFATRVGLPLVITVAGVILIVIGHGGTNSPVAVTGLVLIGVALMVWMLNWMFRMSVESNHDRELEEEARDYYTVHGHWPDEGDDD